MLWAVPKTRRTVEKRLNRKFGDPFYVWKLLKPKTQLKVCDGCGHHHEVGILCAHCYENVRKETELIKEKIEKQLKLDPVDSEVVVLYDGEKGEHVSIDFNSLSINLNNLLCFYFRPLNIGKENEL